MRKTVCLLLASIMSLTLFGCGGSSGSESQSASSTTASNAYSEKDVLSKSEISELFNNPSKFKGRSVKMYGQIFNSIPSDGNGTYFQMYEDPENSENDIIVYVDKKYDVKTDKVVLVKGLIGDSNTYENVSGGEVTSPLIEAESVENATYADAFYPAEKTVKPKASKTFGKAKVTIDKVEFAKKETRVYITIKNNGSSAAEMDSYSATIVQNGKQYEVQDNYNANYKSIPDSVKSGVKASGIIVFEPIKKSDFKLSFSIDCGDNWYDDQEISVSIK